MIEDLKLDSARWEAERRAAAAGRPVNGTALRDSGGHRSSNAQPATSYLTSRTHESRQYYGHSEDTQPPPQGHSSMAPPQDRYFNDPPYPSSQAPPQSFVQPAPSYGSGPPPQGQFPIHQESRDGYYIPSGTHYVNDRLPNGRVPVTQGGSIPRGDVYMQPGQSSQFPPQDSRFVQHPSQVPVSSSQQFNQQYSSGPDPYYRGRA